MAKNILRGSRVKRSSKRANDFISSISFDAPITRHVVSINMAHMLALLESKEVDEEVASKTLAFLVGVPPVLELDQQAEDVHHMIEQEAIRAVGMDTAGYMNLGKSRNDQVATALRMETRVRLLALAGCLCDVQQSLNQPHPEIRKTGHAWLHPPAAHAAGDGGPPPSGYFEGIQRDIDRIADSVSEGQSVADGFRGAGGHLSQG